jgi:hypothetical protein
MRAELIEAHTRTRNSFSWGQIEKDVFAPPAGPFTFGLAQDLQAAQQSAALRAGR